MPLLCAKHFAQYVKFEHATGYKTAENLRTYDSRTYEGAYMAGVIAGDMPRGRNKALIARRDEMLCHRYHYWTETQRLRFDDTLKILSEEEFFLSEERILTILRANGDTLRELAGRPTPKMRRERFPTRRHTPSPRK
jgi:hypothetical protein